MQCFFLIDDDRTDFRRRQRTDDKLCRIWRPKDNVDALAGQLIGHRGDPHATHTDAGADWVDALIVGFHRDLGAHAGVTGSRLDLQQAVIDFGNFQREQLDDELRRRSRENQLRPAGSTINTQQIGLDAIADTQVLAWNHLVTRQQGFDLAGFDDRVATLHALDGTDHQMFLARQEIIENLFALGVADFLQDHLLGSLRADTTEIDRLQRLFQEVTDLDLGILHLRFGQGELFLLVKKVRIGNDLPAAEGFEIAGFAVDHHANIRVVVDALLGSRRQRHFQRAEDDVSGDVLFTCQDIYQQQDFAAHLLITS
jgi:hypothetical protein